MSEWTVADADERVLVCMDMVVHVCKQPLLPPIERV